MEVERVSGFTGKSHTFDLPITQSQLDDYANGHLIQDAFPKLTPTQREYIRTGITPWEWFDSMGSDPGMYCGTCLLKDSDHNVCGHDHWISTG